MLTQEFTLSTMNLDCFDRLSLTAMLDFAAEAAGRDASSLGVGFKDFQRLGYYWVLARVRLEIIDYPNPESQIKITTWPQKLVRNLVAFREFRFTDESGKTLVNGESTWCVISKEARKFVPFPAVFATIPQVRCAALTSEWRRIPLAKGKMVARHIVRPTEIDHNNHYNNAQYVRALLDMLDLARDEVPAAFSISFENEMVKGEEMTLLADREGKTIIASGTRPDGKTAFKAILTLR